MFNKASSQTLDSLCEFINGGAWTEEEYVESGLPVLKVSNFKDNRFSFDELSFLSEQSSKKYAKHKLSKNDLIIATVGSHPNLVNSAAGRTIRANQDIDGYFLNQNAVCLRVKNSNQLNQVYLAYLGETEEFRNYIQVRGKGAASQMRIAIGDVKSFPVKLIPIDMQEKIASILLAYDDLIENNLKRVKLLEEMAQVTYEEWFVRMKFPGHETAVFDEETGLPEGWRNSTLGNECELVMGQSPKSEFYNFDQEGKAFHQGVKDYGYRFPTNTCWTTSGQRLAQPGDILFSVRAPVGRLNIALDEIVLGRGLAAIRHHKNAQSFIFYQLQKIFFEEDMMGGGAIFASVTKNDMLRIELKMPTDNILEKFQALASNCDENIANLHKQISLLKEARDILLPRLMTGIIDIEQVELPEVMQQRLEQQENEMVEV